MTSARPMLDTLLAHRILILDGAMGTLFEQQRLTEADYRGDRFRLHSGNLRGHHDILCLTRPDLVSRFHRAYLEAGADIIKTNTFSSTAVVQADYGLEALAYELNSAAAQLAKEVACEWTARTPDRPRFVAGSIGPTIRRLSRPDEVRRSTSPLVTMDDVCQAYKAQVRGLVDGGCDILLVETIVDPLNAQAAVEAIEAVQKGRPDELPVMLSVTLEPGGRRTLAGQSLDAFSTSTARARPFSVGINCSFGAGHMHAALADLARASNSWVSCHPNAGLPDASGHYGEGPAETATRLRDFADEGLLNIAGGCCGTTPEHIRAVAEALRDAPPRRLAEQRWN